MKIVKLLTVGVIAAFFLASCGKENIEIVTEEVPSIEPEIETIEQGFLRVNEASVSLDTAVMGIFQDVTDNSVLGYFMGAVASDITSISSFFSVDWMLDVPQSVPEVGTYTGDNASTLSQESVDDLIAWIDAGEDPNTVPDLDFVDYDASNLTIDFTNVQLEVFSFNDTIPDPLNPAGPPQIITIVQDQIDITVNGTLVDQNGGSLPISGSFVGLLGRFQ
ncbi:MAG: hypothetical protein AAF598_16265 [Bacteroidota bacterium]